MTTPQPDQQPETAPIELLDERPAAAEVMPVVAEPANFEVPIRVADAHAEVAPAVAPPGMTYVPLAVTIGDGFKFGCGFFLAAVIAALVGFVLLAALFVVTELLGVSFPLGR